MSVQVARDSRAGPTSPSAKGACGSAAGGRQWVFDGPTNPMYQAEHDELFAGIRDGKPINNGDYMARSTLLAIMGRMAAYTGQEVTWEMALNSKEDLSPAGYDWDAAPPPSADRRPGADAAVCVSSTALSRPDRVRRR